MIHRKSCLPLILAALLGLVRPGPPSALAQAPTAAGTGAEAEEVCSATDLSRPNVLEALRRDLWKQRDDPESPMHAVPGTAELTLVPVIKPLFLLRRDFWTGEAVLRPLLHYDKPACHAALLVNVDGQPYATAEVSPTNSDSRQGYDLGGGIEPSPVSAQTLLSMKPSDKLVWWWSGGFGTVMLVEDGTMYPLRDGSRRGEVVPRGTPLHAALATPAQDYSIDFALGMGLLIALTYALLFPWKRRSAAEAEEGQTS